MNERLSRFALRWAVETSRDRAHRFCQVRLSTVHGDIGDHAAWSMVGLVQGAVAHMVERLARQPAVGAWRAEEAGPLLAALRAWHWEGVCPTLMAGAVPADASPADYCAVPMDTEIFDGEVVYLVRTGRAESRLLRWGHAAGEVREIGVDFEVYLARWRALQSALDRDGGGTIGAR